MSWVDFSKVVAILFGLGVNIPNDYQEFVPTSRSEPVPENMGNAKPETHD